MSAQLWKPAALLWLTWCVRLVLAGLFIYAGASKWADPTAFAVEIDNYELLPALAPYLAVTLPTIEVLLGVALVGLPHRWRRAAALGCAALMLAFTGAAVSAMARELNIDCGCFGSGSGPIDGLTLLRDAALLAACALLICDRAGEGAKPSQ